MSDLESVHLQEDKATGDRFLVYGTDVGPKVEIYYQGEELWMAQAQIADLYGRDVSTISRHINNILGEGELDGIYLQKAQINPRGAPTTLFSLDMVISVGYRVSSKQATLFRRWATDKLVQFATKGFVVDVTRLKSPDYRDRVAELRDIIRDIRSDEANVYRELRSICTMCQDYDGASGAWQEFYKTRKLSWFMQLRQIPLLKCSIVGLIPTCLIWDFIHGRMITSEKRTSQRLRTIWQSEKSRNLIVLPRSCSTYLKTS